MKLLDFFSIPYSETDTDYMTSCLWCDSDKLSINKDEGHVFQCWKCKQQGNGLTLLRQLYNLQPALTMKQARELCQRKKGITPTGLAEAGMKYGGGHYLLPVRNREDKLIALHKYNIENNIFYSSPKPYNCSVLGLETLTDAPTLWVAEGHWDTLILRYALRNIPGIDLIGSCGSGFSQTYIHILEDREVVLLFDNDEAGRQGVEHIARKVKAAGVTTRSIRYLDWSKVTLPSSSSIPDKFDIRDWYNELTSSR